MPGEIGEEIVGRAGKEIGMRHAVDHQRLALLLANESGIRHDRHQPGVVVVEEGLAVLDRLVAPVEHGEVLSHVKPCRASHRPRRRIARLGHGKEALALGERMKDAVHVVPEIAPIVPALLPVEALRLGALHLRAGS